MNDESIKSSENISNESNAENTLPEDMTKEVVPAEEVQTEMTEQENEKEVALEEEIPEQKDFIDEFAPASIVIPNYDKEKELKKMEKINLKKKKRDTKKSRRRRRLIKKIVNITCSVLLTVLLLVVSFAVVSSVIVRINTSQYAVENAIKSYGPEKLIIGEIKDYEKLGMNQSAENASLADVLRDNATIPVTYAFIEQEVDSSTYPEFISGITTDIIGHYVFATPYKQIEREEIENLLYKNSSRIKTVTGQELTESDCSKLAKYISKTSVYKEISVTELNKQDAANYTGVTSVMFSFPVLIGLILALLLVLALVIVACKGYAHKIIGWTVLAAGLVSGVVGFFIKPMYVASTNFVKCIIDAVTVAFNKNALIYSLVVVAVGILVLLIGSAMKENDSDSDYDEDEDDNEEDEYIEEIEQVSTAI